MNAKSRFQFSTVILGSVVILLATALLPAMDDHAGGPQAAPPAATAPAVPVPAAKPAAITSRLSATRASISPEATTLTLEVNGAFTYVSNPSGEHLLFVDLPRVVSTQSTESHLLESPLVSSYRVVPYMRGDQPGARLEVLLKQRAVVTYQETGGALQVKFTASGPAAAATPKAAEKPVAHASAPASPAARTRGNSIDQVTFHKESDSTRVQVKANGPIEYHAFQLANPPRLVLDIPQVQSSAAAREIAVGVAPLKTIRVGQFSRKPLVSRIVMDLDVAAPYKVIPQGNGLEIELRSPDKLAPVHPDAAPMAPKASTVSATIEKPEVAPKETKPAENVPATVAAVTNPPAAKAPEIAPQPEVRALPQPTGDVAAAPRAEPARPEAPPLAPMNVTAAAQPPQQRPPSPPTPAPAQADAAGTPGVKYTGEPISVNLKDVDLKDFFRLIHEISGLNIILDPNVSGRVTLVLDDVPWDQALDIVLRNNGLDKQLEGNVLRIARQDTLQKEQEQRLSLETAKQAAADRVTVMRALNYQKASIMLATLAKFSSPKGQMIADDRTNTVIITDIPQVIPTMDDIIKQLDRRTVQVEIEARVVAASRQFSRDVGAQFGFGTSAAGGKTIFLGNEVGANTSPVSVTNVQEPFIPSGGNLPLFSNFPAAGASSGFAILHRSPNAAIDLLISLAEAKGIGKLLSRPRIITQNNVQGTVKQGVQIPIQTTVNNTISVQFTDVTLALTVTPQVTNDGHIFLQVAVQNTTIDPGVPRINGVPALDTQSATTQVLVADGGTIVIGGVLQNQNNLTIQQVPILGSIPVIGNLFKRTGVNTNTNELLFFITPKIV